MSIIEVISSLNGLLHLSPAAESDIQNAQTALNLKFAQDYKAYVSAFGAIQANGIELTGITESPRLSVVAVTKRERDYNETFPENMYVVEDLGLEGLLIVQDENGSIYELAPQSEPKKIFDSLAEYILSVVS